MILVTLRGKLLIALALLTLALPARALIDGVAGTSFTLTARAGSIAIPDGTRPAMWGYARAGGAMQYPGPTLLATQGTTVTVTLVNTLPTSASIVFPGQTGVTARAVKGATALGVLTLEAGPGGTVQYAFAAREAGTYLYHSGTRPDVQIEMGLVGALIVRPAAGGAALAGRAYATPDSAFDVETLFLLTEMDPAIHQLAAAGKLAQADTTGYAPTAWFINGRCAPDTMAPTGAPWLPAQPYNCLPEMAPGMRLLLRVACPGRAAHPFHVEGNHATVIARDGRQLASGQGATLGAGSDLATPMFTIPTLPGGTVDAIFTWTGAGLGWDVYGHQPGDPKAPGELDADHGKPLPVLPPARAEAVYGEWYGGSPYLGVKTSAAGARNTDGSYTFVWGSATAKELTTNNISPGGMMTRLIVHPPGWREQGKE